MRQCKQSTKDSGIFAV